MDKSDFVAGAFFTLALLRVLISLIKVLVNVLDKKQSDDKKSSDVPKRKRKQNPPQP